MVICGIGNWEGKKIAPKVPDSYITNKSTCKVWRLKTGITWLKKHYLNLWHYCEQSPVTPLHPCPQKQLSWVSCFSFLACLSTPHLYESPNNIQFVWPCFETLNKKNHMACFLPSSRNNLLRAVLLCCCVGFSLAVESGGCSPVGVLGLLIAVASLAVGHGLQCTTGFSSCSTRAEQSSFWALEHRLKHLRHTGLAAPQHCDLPRSGIKPASPAMAGGFLTTEPPRKPLHALFNMSVRFMRADVCAYCCSFLLLCNAPLYDLPLFIYVPHNWHLDVFCFLSVSKHFRFSEPYGPLPLLYYTQKQL